MKKIAIALTLYASTASASWTTSADIDPMTGVGSHYANSSVVTSLSDHNFPYNNMQSWFAVGCETGKVWTYIGVKPANLKTDTYGNYTYTVKWDDNITRYTLTESEKNTSFLHFADRKESEVIRNLKKHSKVMIALDNMYRESTAYFEYDLAGSTKAINTILSKCGIASVEAINEPVTLKSERDPYSKMAVHCLNEPTEYYASCYKAYAEVKGDKGTWEQFEKLYAQNKLLDL